MKKNIIKAVAAVVLSAVVSLSLTGCTDPDVKQVISTLNEHPSTNKQINLCIVGGPRSNMFEIPMNSGTIQQYIYNSCYTYGEISIVNAGSAPRVVFNAKINEPDVKGLDEEKLDSIARDYTSQIKSVLNEVCAETEEADILKSIQMGARCLSEVDANTTDKIMLVLDSGLSTTGYMNFAEKNLLNAVDEQEIVEALRSECAIPNLENTTVIWSYLGMCAYPQDSLTTKEVEKLKSIWTAILKAGNAKEVIFSSESPGSTPYTNLPAVSLVDTDEEYIEVKTESVDNHPVVTVEEPIETVILDEGKVHFVGDRAIFLNENEARAEIKKVADMLLEHQNNTVYVVGTTASGEENFTQKLSEDRANAVKEVLMEYGVEEERLITLGLGCYDPWHIPDNKNGWDESKAEQNRKVLIIDTSHEDAELLAPYLN